MPCPVPCQVSIILCPNIRLRFRARPRSTDKVSTPAASTTFPRENEELRIPDTDLAQKPAESTLNARLTVADALLMSFSNRSLNTSR